MVVNGCLLDEAYGTYHKKEKKKKNKKEFSDVEIDRNFVRSGMIKPNENESPFYPVNENYYNTVKKVETQKQEVNEVVSQPQYESGENSEYNRMINDKNYQDYLDFQRNRHNYIHQKDVIETFSTVNDNFNDVLIFALFGMIFLIFTDYIYKLGKKSY